VSKHVHSTKPSFKQTRAVEEHILGKIDKWKYHLIALIAKSTYQLTQNTDILIYQYMLFVINTFINKYAF